MKRGFLFCASALAIASAANAAAPALFVQAQLKYGAQRDDFLHRWYDRPLGQDSSWKTESETVGLNVRAWTRTASDLRLSGFDGVAYFCGDGSTWRNDILEKSLLPGGETGVVMELAGYKGGLGACVDAAGKALHQPNYYRVGGKCVLPLRGLNSVVCPPEFADQVKRAVTERYGDHFLVVPFGVAVPSGSFKAGGPSEEQKEALRENIRAILRVSDGYFQMGGEFVNRRYCPRRFDDVVAPLVRGVLDEPQFRGRKLLGCSITAGHENTYRWQYHRDSAGTDTLCGHLDSMLRLRPDFVICQEWDEENENTFFRPTVFNGYSTARLMRHFVDVSAGRAPRVFPGDDASVPNLILSYRKSIVLGEPVEVEVRNVPDTTFAGETFSVSFSWADEKGRVVKAYPCAGLKADDRGSVWFRSPSAELAAHRLLVPRLSVRTGSGEKTFSDGLFAMDVNVQRCMDYKWVKQPLRDLPRGMEGGLAVGPEDADGVREVRGHVSSPRPLRSVEVLDDMDSAYMHSSEPEVPAGYERIRVALCGFPANKKGNASLSGTIGFEGVDEVRFEPISRLLKTVRPTASAWKFGGLVCAKWPCILYAQVPRSARETGSVVVDLPPFFVGRVRLSELMSGRTFGLNSEDGCGLTVMQYLPTVGIPKPLGTNEVSFAFRWRPLEKSSVLRLQAIDADHCVWRAAPIAIGRASGGTAVVHVLDRDSAEVAEVAVDAGRLETFGCDFAELRDSVIRLGSGRACSGMVGSSAALVQAFGWGESQYGNPLSRCTKAQRPGLARATGWGCLSQQVVPNFAGFELAMEVKPKGFGNRQGLFCSGNCGFDLSIDADGMPVATFATGRDFLVNESRLNVTAKGPRLSDGAWNTVRVFTDRKTAWVEVNGVRGEVVPYSDYFFNQRYALFGASHPDGDYFRGDIRSLRVIPR